MQITRKKIIAVSIIAAVIILFIIMIRSCTSPKNLTLNYEKTGRGDINKTISVTGTLEVLDSQRVLSKIEGIVNEIHVDFNTPVHKGQLLAAIDTADIYQKLLKTQTQLESAKLELDGAQNDLDGKKKMYSENLISKQSMDQAEIKYKTVYYDYRRIQLDYNQIQTQMGYAKLYSPIKGIVMSVDVMPKTSVKEGTLMFQIVPSLSQMLLIISIDESDIGSVKVGQTVYFFVSAFPDKKFTGKISQVRINPMNVGGMVTYQSLVICSNPDQILRPGMTATATVEVASKKNVLRVPNQSLMIAPPGEKTSNVKKIVWIKTVGVDPYRSKEIQTGLSGDMYTEVVSGLKEGEKILVSITESKD